MDGIFYSIGKVRLWNFELFIERIMSKLIHIIIPADSWVFIK